MLLAGCLGSETPSATATPAVSPTPFHLELPTPTLVATATPVSTATPVGTTTPSPTATANGLPGCTLSVSPTSGLGAFEATVNVSFTNLPVDVTHADLTCYAGASIQSVLIPPEKVLSRGCYYPSSSTSTSYTIRVTAGTALCTATVYAGPASSATPTPTPTVTAVPPATIILTLAGSAANQTLAWGTLVNVSAMANAGSVTLTMNGTTVTPTSTSGLFFNLSAGTWVFNATTAGNASYAWNSLTYYLFLTPVAGSASLLLNGSSSAPALTYGQSLNATGSTPYGSLTLYLDGSSASNPFVGNLGGGTHYVSANSSGDGNHTAFGTGTSVTVSPIASTAFLQLNNTSGPSWSYSNATGYAPGGWCTDAFSNVFTPSAFTWNATNAVTNGTAGYVNLAAFPNTERDFSLTCSDANHTSSTATGTLQISCVGC